MDFDDVGHETQHDQRDRIVLKSFSHLARHMLGYPQSLPAPHAERAAAGTEENHPMITIAERLVAAKPDLSRADGRLCDIILQVVRT
ncbi:hypothetical protein [Mesorhizobium sp.]|uniref:hypothetical protein n=1 Tax=Mesorhizobium sp. TaxID=1871066 RepID=UPI000FE9C612|nr:hypothetical protein [Mesorhizobium sp.]RWM77798.1 MAG: hypothetical protein EOR83_33140 [Mesorhizobium sp.]